MTDLSSAMDFASSNSGLGKVIITNNLFGLYGEEYQEWKAQFGESIKAQVKFHKDCPKPGMLFVDIFSLTKNSKFAQQLYQNILQVINCEIGQAGVDFNTIVGLEPYGFIFGPVIANLLELPFVPIQKTGKLPGKCY